jgi:nucleoside-diphosphate-sugar epimerase
MKTIGIIGASSQVGTEVCLFLKTYPDIRVIGIVRASISGAILRRCGISVRVGTFDTAEECVRLVGDCDLIVDFSVISTGDFAATRAHYKQYVSGALRGSPAFARYVFISTINAFGMGDEFNRAKYYWVAHSVYATTKRHAERLALRFGKLNGKQVFVFRLGHVHGILQRVSFHTAEIVSGPYLEYEYPDTPSYTIFCHTIAEALINVLAGREVPGIYTLISDPPWSWAEVLRYYAPQESQLTIRVLPSKRAGWRAGIIGWCKEFALGFVTRYRETLRANLLHRVPGLQLRIQASFYRRRARQQVHEWKSEFVYRPPPIHEGVFPGKRLRSLSDSRITMPRRAIEVQRILDAMPPATGGTNTVADMSL